MEYYIVVAPLHTQVTILPATIYQSRDGVKMLQSFSLEINFYCDNHIV